MSTKSALQEEAAAWRGLAERIATTGLGGHGLCMEIGVSPFLGEIAVTMRHRIDKHLNPCITLDTIEPLGPFRWTGQDRERANIRILAALFLALECDDEANP